MLIKKGEIENNYINIYSLSNKKIGIPIFQRFYAWKEVQTKQLLSDILEAMKSNKQLYLLDFIYYENGKKIMIADGQQRLVTMNLLIKAINDVIETEKLKFDKIKPFDIYYDIEANNTKYQKSYLNDPVSPFKKVYNYLRTFVYDNKKDIDKMTKVVTEKIYIFFKKCSNVDDAFSVFQQINTGGKPLTKDEIIKTALDQYSVMYDVKINTSKIKTIRQDIISYYKYTEDNYNINFDNMAIMSFLNKYITTSKEKFQDFKLAIDKLDKLEENPIYSIIKYINRPSLFDVMNVLAMKSIDLKREKKYINQVLIPLCLSSITLSLNGGNPVLMKYLTDKLIKKIKSGENVDKLSLLIASYINNNEKAFKISLEKFTNILGPSETNYYNIKKALLILDVVHKNTAGTLDVSTINLEHIYPQNPHTKWAINGWPTNIEDQKRICNNIGNYLLLNEEINKTIKNKYITDKVDKYKEIIPKDLMLQTKINTVDFEKFESKREEYINERQRYIAKMIMDEMPFGNVLITK